MPAKDVIRSLTPPLVWQALQALRRHAWNDKPVTRNVRGVDLLMGRTHALPDYTGLWPLYDTALPAFAAFLMKYQPLPLKIVDVGANIGDTACLIAAAVGYENVRFLCVEADESYLQMLRYNTRNLHIEIVPAIAGRFSGEAELAPSRSGKGTSSLVASKDTRRQVVKLDDLRFGDVTILKTDTDGYENEVLAGATRMLATALALFIEYSPRHLREYGSCQPPRKVLALVRAGGFRHALVYDSFGYPMGVFSAESLNNLCEYVDLQRSMYLDLLFCRDEALLCEFAGLENARARSQR